MTRRDPHVFPDLDWLPRPPALERDPELALLAVLHTALEAVVYALVAVHPHLATPDPPPDPDILAARRLLTAADHLRRQLARYCRELATLRAQLDVETNDDFPF